MGSLYLHIPFCLSKCPYCDFFSRRPQNGEITAYVDAMCIDIHTSAEEYSVLPPLTTIFFGGGTPSLLSAAQIDKLLQAAQTTFSFSSDIEITLEANPGTIDQKLLTAYRSSGINRLSLGVQSFDDSQLTFLGRRHNCTQSLAAIAAARAAGFNNLNIDLMFALPGQSSEQLYRQCRQLHQIAPEHLSIYGLTIEENTPFAQLEQLGDIVMPDEEEYRQDFLFLHQELSNQGYNHYEISNYCRPGYECRHNLSYWNRRPYLGIGAGAHSFSSPQRGCRWSCENSITKYINRVNNGKNPRRRIETFNLPQAMAETAYLGLRTGKGIDEQQFYTEYHHHFATVFATAIDNCGSHLQHNNGHWRLTPESWLIYDHLISHFLHSAPPPLDKG